MPEEQVERLTAAALEARQRSYSPYSGFAVGAALLTRGGEIVRGCNIENRSYGMTICAERTAFAAANAAGHREFTAIAVAADCRPPARPCGLCLDTMAEFADELEIVLVNLQGERERYRLSELLPHPFRFS